RGHQVELAELPPPWLVRHDQLPAPGPAAGGVPLRREGAGRQHGARGGGRPARAAGLAFGRPGAGGVRQRGGLRHGRGGLPPDRGAVGGVRGIGWVAAAWSAGAPRALAGKGARWSGFPRWRCAMDSDLDGMSREQLVAEVVRLRNAIRAHRDSSGHALCWYHPDLWSLLPEQSTARPVVPEWSVFLHGCIRYRQSLDEQLADAPRSSVEYPGDGG